MDDDEIVENEPTWDDLGDSGEAANAVPEESYPRRPTRIGSDRREASHIWLISYSDFMTIMMIFFLAMYGYTYMAKKALLKPKEKMITYSEFALEVGKLRDAIDPEIEVTQSVEKVEIKLPVNVLFQSGAARLSKTALETVEDLANSIKLVAGQVIVEGHTDDVPVLGGTYRSNWELSAARAFSVIDALIGSGVNAERLGAWGFGEYRPVASNETPEGRNRNRRISIVVLKDKPKTET